MTSAEAWEHLAKLWSEPWKGYKGFACVIIRTRSACFGLCGCIENLLIEGLISKEVERSMVRSIKRLEKPDNLESSDYKLVGYFWPLTMEGAKERSAFCQAMAEKCRKRERQKRRAKRVNNEIA